MELATSRLAAATLTTWRGRTIGTRGSRRATAVGVYAAHTPTYSGCPAMRAIEDSIREALELRGDAQVSVRTTFTPAWTTDSIPESAKAKLEAYGIAPPGPVTADGTRRARTAASASRHPAV